MRASVLPSLAEALSPHLPSLRLAQLSPAPSPPTALHSLTRTARTSSHSLILILTMDGAGLLERGASRENNFFAKLQAAQARDYRNRLQASDPARLARTEVPRAPSASMLPSIAAHSLRMEAPPQARAHSRARPACVLREQQ